MALAAARNYDPFQAPTHFKLSDLLKKLDKTFGATGKNYGKVGKDRTFDDIEQRRRDRWNFLFIAGMWFQDLFNYDFRRTEQCIIPYATQEGEISFCAYNTGVGWRNIIEKMHMTATLTKWYDEHGRHEIFAGGKAVPLDSREHSLVLREEIVTNEEQHDLDRLGIAKNAREEKTRARDAKLKEQQEHRAHDEALPRARAERAARAGAGADWQHRSRRAGRSRTARKSAPSATERDVWVCRGWGAAALLPPPDWLDSGPAGAGWGVQPTAVCGGAGICGGELRLVRGQRGLQWRRQGRYRGSQFRIEQRLDSAGQRGRNLTTGGELRGGRGIRRGSWWPISMGTASPTWRWRAMGQREPRAASLSCSARETEHSGPR